MIKKPTKKEVRDFVKSQQSLQFYKRTQQAFEDVLSKMSKKDFEFLTKNLIVLALHEGVLGQMMHFPNSKGKIQNNTTNNSKWNSNRCFKICYSS